MSTPLGTLQSILRVPIKSFQGESIERTTLSASGIEADRPFALRSRETGKIVSGKNAQLGERVLGFDARYDADPVPGNPLPGIVATIDAKEIRVEDREAFEAACSAALDHPVELVAAGDKQTYDSYWPEVEDLPLAGATIDLDLPLAEAGSFADLEPLHILTTASLETLQERAGESRIEVARFRPSLLIDTGQATGFVEHEWTGSRATLGGATLEFGEAAPRCIMTTRAQAGLPKDPGILKAIVRENRHEFMTMQMPCLGVYAKVVEAGEVAVGDELKLV